MMSTETSYHKLKINSEAFQQAQRIGNDEKKNTLRK